MSNHPFSSNGNSNGNGKALLTFPTRYPLKIFITNEASEVEYRAKIIAILEADGIEYDTWSANKSKSGKYLCLTVVLTLQSQEQLNELYTKIRALEAVKLIL